LSQQSTIEKIYDIIPFIILGLLIASVGVIWILVINPYLDSLGDKSHLRYEKNEAEEQVIKSDIEKEMVTCEYVSDLRMKYAGDSFINALDDSLIKSKLMTYWNTHNCGVEWEWWD